MLKMRLSTEWLLLLGCLWLVGEFVVLGNASVMITADNGEHFVPGLIGGGFSGAADPLWNNLSAGGIDRVAQGYFGDIDVFLFTHIPGWLAHGLRIASLYIVAVLSAFALCRRTFGFGEGASLFVAFVYGVKINAYLVSSVFAYLPGVILALTYLLARKTDAKRWLLALLVLYFMAATAYFSRLVPFAAAVIVAWFIFADTKKTRADWAIILGGGIMLVALRIKDFLALLKQSPLSQMPLVRVQESIGTAFESAFFPPMFFNGPLNIIVFGLFIYALIVRRGGDLRMKLVLAGILLGVALPPLGTAIQRALLDVMPFLHGYSISLVSLVVDVLYIFAAGYGMQALLENSQARGSNTLFVWANRAALAAAVGVLAFASIKDKAASAYNWVTHGSFAKNFDSPVIHDLAAKVRHQPWPVRVESFQMHPGYLHAYGLETAGGYSPMLLRRYYEFWGKVVEPWAGDIGPESRYFVPFNASIKGNGGQQRFRGERLMLMPEDYQPEWRLEKLYRLNLLSLANVTYFISRDRLMDGALEPVREMHAPWSSLSKRQKARLNVEANFSGFQHLYVYRNKQALPRFFSVKNIKVFGSAKSVLDAIAKASVQELRSTLFVEERHLSSGVSSKRNYSEVEISLNHYDSDEIRLTVSADGPAVLIVGNSFSPYWSSEVDGVKTPIFPADHAFWGVALPKGAKSVVFRYQPPYR